MTEFSVFVCLKGIASAGNIWLESLAKGLQNYLENKNEGNENKIILGGFNCTMDKMEWYGGNKTLYRCCSNYAVIVDNGLRFYGEGKTQILPL